MENMRAGLTGACDTGESDSALGDAEECGLKASVFWKKAARTDLKVGHYQDAGWAKRSWAAQ